MQNRKRNPRTRRNRRKGKSNGPTNQPLGAPFPPTKTVVLRYSDTYQLVEGAAGTGALQQWRSGDAYDPDYSGVGHQPLYFDQLCAADGPYLVFSCPKSHFKFRFVNNSSSVPALLVLFGSIAALPLLDRTEAVEKPYAWVKMLAPLGSGAATESASYKMDNAKFVGVPPATYVATNTGNYGASSGSPFMNCYVYGVAGIADVTVEVQLDIVTKFYQLGNMRTS